MLHLRHGNDLPDRVRHSALRQVHREVSGVVASKAEQFFNHLSECECGTMPYFRCEIGRELLIEAADELSEEWHEEIRRLYRDIELRREANENFRYYNECTQDEIDEDQFRYEEESN